MAAWDAAAAAPEPVARPARRPPAARPARRRAPERRVAGPVVWIGFLTLLLTGVVALNVAVLRMNMRLEELGRERAELRAENAALSSRLSSSRATARIQALAQKKLGLVPASVDETSYVELGRPAR